MKWLERQRHFVDFVLSSLMRRKGKNASLFLVYSLMIFLVASVMFFTTALRNEAIRVLDNAPEIVIQRLVAGRHALIPLSYIDGLKKIRGIGRLKGRLWGYYYHPAAGANYTVMAPDKFQYDDRQIVVGAGVVRTWQPDKEGRLYFRSYDGEALPFKIAATLSSDSELLTADLILVSAATFRRLFGIPEGFATDLAARVRNQREWVKVAEKITLIHPDTRPILKDEVIRTYGSLFDWRSGYVIVLLGGAFLAFFIFAWDKATGLSAEEKAEIGILKAVGWDTSDILLMRCWEGAIVSLGAFLLGAIAAYIHVFVASAPLFEHALKGWAILYPAFKLEPHVDYYELGTLFFLTVFPYTLVTIVPIWKVSITDPDAVMRQV